MTPWSLWLFLLGLTLPAARNDPARPAKYSIEGIVVDSIRARPLAGAEVVLSGTTVTAITDSAGRFRLDSLDAGSYRVAFFHPMLDSISISIAPSVLHVPLEAGKAVMLAVPSVATVMRRICETDDIERRSILVGRITDPETAAPVAGASVFVTWTDFEVENRNLRRTPRTVQGGTDTNGVYRVCGLPAELDGVVYAIHENSSTSRVAIASRRQDIVVRDLQLEDPESAVGRRASIAGTIRTAKGAPVSGATVSVAGSGRTATTDDKGHYSLSGLPLGTRNVLVRRLGFVAVNIPVDLSSQSTKKVDAVLEEFVLVMDPMYVIARRDRQLARVGFTKRRGQGLGDFRTRADFAKNNPVFLSDIVGTMRGVRVDYAGGRRILRAAGQGSECVHLVVDGNHWQSVFDGDTDDAVLPEDVAAVEVYSGAGVPPEFENPYTRGCLTIVIWTRTRVKDLVK
jgi:hypothetical protein